jgi:plastocyanin
MTAQEETGRPPMMRAIVPILTVTMLAAGCAPARMPMVMPASGPAMAASHYLPDAEAAKVVSVTEAGAAVASVLIQTHAVAVKENGPAETVARFGEVYAFSPNFIAVHRDEPTQVRFWNLQSDDDHDFMLVDPHLNVLMNLLLPHLEETAYVFTFHEEGLFTFYCAMHQPSMSGQILVLPPARP